MRRVWRRSPVLWSLVALALGLVGFTGATSLSVPAFAHSAVATSTMPSSCPTQDRNIPASGRSGASASMAPSGAQQLLICRYSGFAEPGTNIGAFDLITSRQISDAAAVANLASELDAIPASGPYPIACPADFGGTLVAYFGYSTAPDNPVSVALSGCQSISNGTLTRLGLDAPVVSQLSALVPSVSLGPGPVILHDGTIAGSIRGCRAGGCPRGDRVAVRQGKTPIAETTLHHGRFSLSVYPGTYTIQLTGRGHHGLTVLRHRVVSVDAGHTARIVFRLR
jgi:hypothetical protein